MNEIDKQDVIFQQRQLDRRSFLSVSSERAINLVAPTRSSVTISSISILLRHARPLGDRQNCSPVQRCWIPICYHSKIELLSLAHKRIAQRSKVLALWRLLTRQSKKHKKRVFWNPKNVKYVFSNTVDVEKHCSDDWNSEENACYMTVIPPSIQTSTHSTAHFLAGCRDKRQLQPVKWPRGRKYPSAVNWRQLSPLCRGIPACHILDHQLPLYGRFRRSRSRAKPRLRSITAPAWNSAANCSSVDL